MKNKVFVAGSALILVVVLTGILAIVGALFVMASRIENLSSSSVIYERDLSCAVDTVVAKISNELALDVPGVADAEYYDYPSEEDRWLASIEPYDKDPDPNQYDYYWGRISDVTGYLHRRGWDTNDVELRTTGPYLLRAVVRPNAEIELDDEGELLEQLADADGDGVADAKWIQLPDITSSKGKPIYAAIRIIDNGAMLNVNTAYQFDQDGGVSDIDGSSPMQINLAALAERGSGNTLDELNHARFGAEPQPYDFAAYEGDVVWRYDEPNGLYTPFDISDELKLRNRYILNYNLMTSRIEEFWDNVYDVGLDVPRTESSQLKDPNSWFWKANDSSPDIDDYDYRHISTIYNMDRILNPDGKEMVNINRINNRNDVNWLYTELLNGLDPCLTDAGKIAAQIAVNLKDYRDSDSTVTHFDANGVAYYGFERPCVYISELAHRFEPDPCDPNIVYRSYAVELHKPYREDPYPDSNQWRLSITGYSGSPIDVHWSGAERFHVILWQHPRAPLTVSLDSNDPNLPGLPQQPSYDPNTIVFDASSVVSLQRLVDDVNNVYLVVDSIPVPDANTAGGWLAVDANSHSIQRDVTLHKCIRRLWDASSSSPTLGSDNKYVQGDSSYIQAHPADADFTNVGEIGMLFRKGAYYEVGGTNSDTIGYSVANKIEDNVRLNLADANFQDILNYLTVLDPTTDNIDNDGDGVGENGEIDADELKIPGRININTAPWYVIAQLPWVSQRKNEPVNYDLARAIVAYRDALKIPGGPDYTERLGRGFANIGQLNDVTKGLGDYSMGVYATDGNDLHDFPDLTPADDAKDDFEERDVVFARISNLVTVRSDVFTAYILVRIGADGPQRRVVAIFDRSDVYKPSDKVKLVALQMVPDPR